MYQLQTELKNPSVCQVMVAAKLGTIFGPKWGIYSSEWVNFWLVPIINKKTLQIKNTSCPEYEQILFISLHMRKWIKAKASGRVYQRIVENGFPHHPFNHRGHTKLVIIIFYQSYISPVPRQRSLLQFLFTHMRSGMRCTLKIG